jgi:indolepyruvate decarboxylase
MTAQELSTILRRGLKPIIFLVNNNGYTIERLILGPGSSYNDINQWRYAEAASFFDTQGQTVAYRVRTEDELEDALAAARDRETFMLIELKMSRLDAPGPLVNFAQRCAEFNFPSSARFDNPAHEESSEAPQQRLSGVQYRRPSEAIGHRAYNSQKADH